MAQLTALQIVCQLKAAGATAGEALTLLQHVPSESGCNSQAVNNSAPCGNGVFAHGLFQICPNNLPCGGAKVASDLLDPLTNAKCAVSILRSQGEGAWDSSRSTNACGSTAQLAVNTIYSNSGAQGDPCADVNIVGSADQAVQNIPNPFNVISDAINNVFSQWQSNATRIFLVFIAVLIIMIGIILLLFGDLRRPLEQAAKLTPEGAIVEAATGGS